MRALRRVRHLACALVFLDSGALAHADSPLSSTGLAAAYTDLAVVRDVRTSRELDADALALLLGPGRTEHKAAVVSALGWGGDATVRGRQFVTALAVAHGMAAADLRLEQLSAVDRFVLGYLLAMGQEPVPLRAGAGDLWGATPRELLAQAASALPKDFTVHYVRALVEAQEAMASSWCGVYMATRQVLDRFPAAQRNMRAQAVTQAQAYIDLYKKECDVAPAATTGSTARRAALPAEANQVYALARLGSSLLAATQWGAVVWDPERKEPASSRREELCATVLVWREAAYFGCEARVARWDGQAWKSYLHEPAKDGVQYDLVVHPREGLLARYGSRVFAYDAARDTFAPSSVSLGRDSAAWLVRANGEVWWIELMRAVHGPRGTYTIGSAEYPGTDPRHLVEDSQGRLFVVDFGSGVYRLREGGAFTREDGLSEKGSAVATDAARGRTWLLHYTRGPVLLTGDAPPRPFDTSDLEYMRDLLVDPDGSLWIAGWNKILHLRDTPSGWKRDELVAR